MQAEALEAGVRRLAAALEHPKLVLQHLREGEGKTTIAKTNSLSLATSLSPTTTFKRTTPTTTEELTSIEREITTTTTELSTELPNISETNLVSHHVEPSAWDNKSETRYAVKQQLAS